MFCSISIQRYGRVCVRDQSTLESNYNRVHRYKILLNINSILYHV